MAQAETWESLRDKALDALKNDDAAAAEEHLTDAIALSPDNHELLFTRGSAFIQLEKWSDAVADLEKAASLKPTFEKGHVRLGVAQYGAKDFIGARRAYQNALNLNLDNEEYKKAIESCKEATDKVAADDTAAAGEKAIPELVQKLSDPKQIAKLKEHKTTGVYFRDPEFNEMLDNITKNPSTVKQYLTEPRMLQCIGVMLDMPLVDTVANTQLKREQFTISSDEESEEESDSDSDDDGCDNGNAGAEALPQPLSKSRPAPKAADAGPVVHQDGLLQGLPIQAGGDGGGAATPGVHRVDADVVDPNVELRKQVAAKLGMTVEQMDRMSRFSHTGSFEKGGGKAADGAGGDGGGSSSGGGGNAAGGEPATAAAAAAAAAAAPAPPAKPKQPEVEDDPAEVFLPESVPEAAADRAAVAVSVKDQGTAYYKGRKFRCALKLYAFADSIDAANMVHKLNMAAAHLELKEHDRAVECCDLAIAAGEAAGAEGKLLGKAHSRRGKALVALKQFGDAVKAFKRALEHNRCAEYLNAKINALKLHEKELAERERDPLKAQGCKARGNDHYQKGEYAEAVREYEQAVRHDPDNKQLLSRVYSNRCACYTKMGEMALAMKDAEACIAADPAFVKGYVRKGRVLNITEQWAEAAKAFEEALRLDPHNYDARSGLDKARKGVELLSQTAASRAEQAMQKKEIREIWEDTRWLLKEMSENPDSSVIKKELDDPVVRAKLAKLREAGLM